MMQLILLKHHPFGGTYILGGLMLAGLLTLLGCNSGLLISNDNVDRARTLKGDTDLDGLWLMVGTDSSLTNLNGCRATGKSVAKGLEQRLEFSGSKLLLTRIYFDGASCTGQELGTIEHEFDIAASPEADFPRNIELYSVVVYVSPLISQWAQELNADSFCGLTNWLNGQVREVSGLTCVLPGEGPMRFPQFDQGESRVYTIDSTADPFELFWSESGSSSVITDTYFEKLN